LTNERNGSARTYVAVKDTRVVGFYTLAVGGVEHAKAPDRIVKGLAHHPVPVVILARLAVDRQAQRSGLGRHLLRDAMGRAERASRDVGIRALLIHAEDDAAKDGYRRFAEFDIHPSDEYQLLLLM